MFNVEISPTPGGGYELFVDLEGGEYLLDDRLVRLNYLPGNLDDYHHVKKTYADAAKSVGQIVGHLVAVQTERQLLKLFEDTRPTVKLIV